jgi:hypothetical protein
MDERYDYKQPDLDEMRKNFLGDPKASSDYVWPIEVEKDFVHMTEINPSIILGWGSKASSVDQPLNRAISTMIDNESHDVRGPVIAYGQMRTAHGPVDKSPIVTDLDTTDLNLVVNYFLGRHRDLDAQIKAVRIYSNGEQSRSGCRYDRGTLRCARVILCNDDTGFMSQISLLFSMPLVLDSALLFGEKHMYDPVLSDRMTEYRSLLPPDMGNRIATLLMIDIGYHEESKLSEFGTVPQKYVTSFSPHTPPLNPVHR